MEINPARIDDFARLYGHHDAPASPLMAWRLWSSAVFMADTYSDPRSWPYLTASLPPIAQRCADETWLARFVECFVTIANRLLEAHSDGCYLATCTGDEMALHIVIDWAHDSTEMLPVDEGLPTDVERDDAFDWAREVFFRDHDVLMLFEANLDGIEDEALYERFQFANLHPRQWFLPFADLDEGIAGPGNA